MILTSGSCCSALVTSIALVGSIFRCVLVRHAVGIPHFARVRRGKAQLLAVASRSMNKSQDLPGKR